MDILRMAEMLPISKATVAIQRFSASINTFMSVVAEGLGIG